VCQARVVAGSWSHSAEEPSRALDAMGGVLGALNPVSSEKQAEIQRLIKTIIDTFTPVYLQEYAKCLVIKARMDFEAAQEEPPLLSKWKPVDTEPVAEGYLTKEGANTKNWKKRYFVIHPNWVVEYYENEQQAHTAGAKPKGVMHLQGYKVHEDPGNHLLKKAKKTSANYLVFPFRANSGPT